MIKEVVVFVCVTVYEFCSDHNYGS